MSTTAPPTPSPWARVVGVVGLLAHLAVGIPYASTAVIAPSWAVAAVVVIWAVFLVITVVTMVRAPLVAPAVPLAAFVIWVVILAIGVTLLGWEA